MLGLIKKIFGTAQTRSLSRYGKIVKEVNRYDEEYTSLTDDELRNKTQEFRDRYAEGETLDALLPEAYAAVKNACRRLCGKDFHVSGYDQVWDMVPYDVQILGAIGMHYGAIAEMQTGEGKTLTAAMPLYLNAISGQGVHLVTVNDYLARRDSEWIGAIYRFLGTTVSALTNDVSPFERREVYQADIVYGTASEFGFDYLRDNSMARSAEEQVQRNHFFVIIDEADSILIDEARTPLIISGPTQQTGQLFDELKIPVASVVKKQRDLCTKLASDAKKTLDKLGLTREDEQPKLSKDAQKEAEEAYKTLWLVGKGTPNNKTLKKLKEHPDIRASIEEWETYFHGEPNKEERAEKLRELFIIVDERANDHELTDKGITAWEACGGNPQDFVMLDLGHEYAEIDRITNDEKQRVEKKAALQEQDGTRKERAHTLRQLFRAQLLMDRDVDYIVQDGKIVIIDENTGRPQPGRRFSDGLHQAIEAKEGVEIQAATQTYATITLQNYFRLYDKIAGMSGTAITEAQELREIYKLDVLIIPTHRKCVRKDADDEIYMTEREKFGALLKEIQTVHEQGRPILIGTESVDVSEKLSRILKQNKLPHTVLNAKHHEQEAEIIARAGNEGAITVATNMAGRGTDIKVSKEVAERGGLHVIGTTRHQSRRIDRQLRGRTSRQGDPGSSKFYVSFEDQLMRLFTSPNLTSFLQRFRPPEGEPITAKILNKSIETAQKRVEQRNYSMRKHTLEYDDVMNMQRKEVYAFRNQILTTEDPFSIGFEILEAICYRLVAKHYTAQDEEGHWDKKGLTEEMMMNFPVTIEPEVLDNELLTMEDVENLAVQRVRRTFRAKLEAEAQLIAAVQKISGRDVDPLSILSDIVRNILLSRVDMRWQQHLLAIDNLRSEVSMRAIGQKDPLQEFKHEAFALFEELNRKLRTDISHMLFTFQMIPPESAEMDKAVSAMQQDSFPEFFPEEIAHATE